MTESRRNAKDRSSISRGFWAASGPWAAQPGATAFNRCIYAVKKKCRPSTGVQAVRLVMPFHRASMCWITCPTRTRAPDITSSL